MTVGSLFSGIGGLELGLEMGGPFTTLWQAERDPYASAVLAKHWPSATRFTDVRDVTAATVPGVDVLCGGFPCQPHSLAGKRLSSADERDLWGEFARIAGDLKPRWVVAENVPGLLSSHDPAHGRGAGGFFGRVLRDLAQLGFDAEWHSIPAAAVGAPHLRYRVFLMAYPGGAGREEQHAPAQPGWAGHGAGRSDAAVRHAAGAGFPDWAGGEMGQPSPLAQSQRSGRRAAQRDIRGVVDGVPADVDVTDGADTIERVDRLKALGNAVVPQVGAVIGRAIREAEECRRLTGQLPQQIVTRQHLEATA